MRTHLLRCIERGQAGQCSLVSLEMTDLVAFAMLVTNMSVGVNCGSSALGRVSNVVPEAI